MPELPENFRGKDVSFSELADDGIEWAKAHKLSWHDDQTRLMPLREAFGNRSAASITPQEIERWFASDGVSRNRDKKRQKKPWKPAAINRYRALISMVYRQGIKNQKVSVNPARDIEKRKEDNVRVRYLLSTEETALRTAMTALCPERLPELDIALNCGMRRSEQYGCDWQWVDLDRRVLTIPRSKHGEQRHVYLNDVAVAAFRLL